MAMIFHDIRMNFSCRDYTEAKVHRTVKNMMKSILTLKVLNLTLELNIKKWCKTTD